MSKTARPTFIFDGTKKRRVLPERPFLLVTGYERKNSLLLIGIFERLFNPYENGYTDLMLCFLPLNQIFVGGQFLIGCSS
jgi:hypothetical protein